MFPLFILAIENDDDRAFIQLLYEQYYPVMKKKAYEISRDYNATNDLVNNSFIKLIDKIPTLRSLDCCKRTAYIVYTIKLKCFRGFPNKRGCNEAKVLLRHTFTLYNFVEITQKIFLGNMKCLKHFKRLI